MQAGLSSDQLLVELRVPCAGERDLCGGIFEGIEVAWTQLNLHSMDVFSKPVEFGSAWNGDDPGLLRQEPGQSQLAGGGPFLLSKASDQIDKCLVGFPVLLGEARNGVAEVCAVELCFFGDGAGEEALAQRTEGNEADSEFSSSVGGSPFPALSRRANTHSVVR